MELELRSTEESRQVRDHCQFEVKMLVKEVNSCSFDQWYPLFKKVTFKSIILPIPNEVLDYLRSDGSLVLPKECDGENGDSPSEDSEENEVASPSFPEFNKLIKDSIERLGGKVFCKLNWSAPRDAAWMGPAHSLECQNLSQIWLLLKSSDFITHDLTQPYKDCLDMETEAKEPDYILVLKRWSSDLNPATEFRCYIKSRNLVAIEQRDATNFYAHIKEDEASIVSDIKSFFKEFIKDKLLADNIVMDVCRPTKDLVRLVDFNPFGITTDTCLFTWEELEQLESGSNNIDFRFVSNQAGIQPSGLRHYSIPRDIVDLASGTDPDKLVDFLELQANLQKKDDESKT